MRPERRRQHDGAGTWWAALAAAIALGVVGPSVADETRRSRRGGRRARRRSEAMYEFLVAEIAAQRGDTEGALAIYHRMARELRDPQIARRAVEMAIRARAFGPALESASLLLELDPESTLAREIIAALLANEATSPRRRTRWPACSSKNAEPRRRSLMQLHAPASRNSPTRPRCSRPPQAIAEPYHDMPEAHYALGVAALLAERLELARREADAALAMRARLGTGRDPQGAGAAQVRARRGASPSTSDSSPRHPDSHEVRMQLGPRARRRAQARRGARAVPRGREARAEATPQAALRGRACCRCRSRISPTRRPRSRARCKPRLPRARGDLPRPGPGGRGPEALRRGDRLVPEGRVGRLGARAAEDRDAHRAPAGPRRRAASTCSASSRAPARTASR